jgi:hypothetical protein
MNTEVKVQLQPEYRGNFRSNGKKIVCRECMRNNLFSNIGGCVYETSSFFRFLTDGTPEFLLNTINEEGFREGAKKTDDQATIVDEIEVSLEAIANMVAKHRMHIADKIFTLRCPNPRCRQVSIDHALIYCAKCEACGHHFCALCLSEIRDSAAYQHFLACLAAADARRRGAVTIDLFHDVQRHRHGEILRKYLLERVPWRCRTALLDVMERDLTSLGLHPLLLDPALTSPGQPTRLRLAWQRKTQRAIKAACGLLALGLRLRGTRGTTN